MKKQPYIILMLIGNCMMIKNYILCSRIVSFIVIYILFVILGGKLMLKWKEEYVIGVDQIDEQHEMLFKIAERAFTLLKSDMYVDKYDKIITIIEELKDYAVYHFRSEEEYMLSIGYRKFLSHKAEHDEFINKVTNTDLNKIDVDQNAYLLSVLEFVVNWTSEHILQRDKLITA